MDILLNSSNIVVSLIVEFSEIVNNAFMLVNAVSN